MSVQASKASLIITVLGHISDRVTSLLLTGKRFRRAMDHSDNRTWVLQVGGRLSFRKRLEEGALFGTGRVKMIAVIIYLIMSSYFFIRLVRSI